MIVLGRKSRNSLQRLQANQNSEGGFNTLSFRSLLRVSTANMFSRVYEILHDDFCGLDPRTFCASTEELLSGTSESVWSDFMISTYDDSVFIAHLKWTNAKKGLLANFRERQGKDEAWLDLRKLQSFWDSDEDPKLERAQSISKVVKWVVTFELSYRCFDHFAVSRDATSAFVEDIDNELLELRISNFLLNIPERFCDDTQLMDYFRVEIKSKIAGRKKCSFYGSFIVENALFERLSSVVKQDAQWTAQIVSTRTEYKYDQEAIRRTFQERHASSQKAFIEFWESKSPKPPRYESSEQKQFLDLLFQLVFDPSSGLEAKAREVFDVEYAQRRTSDRPVYDRYIQSWREYLSREAWLYVDAISSLATTPLEADCKNLLLSHLTQVIPSLIKKTRNHATENGNVRLPKDLERQIGFLENQSRAASDLDVLLGHLKAFNQELDISMDSIRVSDMKRARLQGLCDAMGKDTDGPRLFLHLIVVLWSASPGNEGVIYITGKSCPRILKILAARAENGELSQESAERVFHAGALKDTVKNGTMTEEGVAWMRRAAREAVEEWKDRQDDAEDST